ncbi:hypothetical protein [Nocardioides sp.]|uniref:hypothetical protein n=1 Tax=Nocardioides sp. TaxID=35761 RepID=UPI003219214D
MTRVVLVPGVLALLPEYAGLSDPVADLRAACLEAVATLGVDVEVLATGSAARVAHHLLDAAPRHGEHPSYLVVGNGSATRSEKAPGHLDERAADFDRRLHAALAGPDPAALAGLDQDLATELWADTGQLGRLGELLEGGGEAQVTYAEAPYGVQYWVAAWTTR